MPNGDKQSEMERQVGRITQNKSGNRRVSEVLGSVGKSITWPNQCQTIELTSWKIFHAKVVADAVCTQTTSPLLPFPCTAISFQVPVPAIICGQSSYLAGNAGGIASPGNNSPPMTDKNRWINTPAPLPLRRADFGVYVLLSFPGLPQWDCTPVAHSSNWLNNTHFIGCPLFPSHFHFLPAILRTNSPVDCLHKIVVSRSSSWGSPHSENSLFYEVRTMANLNCITNSNKFKS